MSVKRVEEIEKRELKKWPPRSPAALWIVNVLEGKPRQNIYIYIYILYVFINVRLWFKLDNRADKDKSFPAFLHSDETCKSKFRLLSISTPSNFCFLLFQIFICPILAQIFLRLCLETKRWHFSWFSFIWLFSNHSIAKRPSCSNLLIRELRSLLQA